MPKRSRGRLPQVPPLQRGTARAALDAIDAPGVLLRDTGTAKGRGVYACRRYGRGDLVEVAPVLVMRCSFDALPAELKTYVFNWEDLTGLPGTHALALGYGSLYNHANPSNLCFQPDARASLMRFVAGRDISPGEELTINYSAEAGAITSDDDDWFERFGIPLITG